MKKTLVSFFQFCFLGSMIIILGLVIFDFHFPERTIFLFFFSFSELGFAWLLVNFLLDARQYSRDGWNFVARKPRVVIQWGTEPGGPEMSPEATMWFGYPFTILFCLGFSVLFGMLLL